MQREIKFRAKKRHWKDFEGWDKWQYSNGFYFDGVNYWFIAPNDKPVKSLDGSRDTYPLAWTKHIIIDPETLGEYTGLKDKKGKEIYGGDWVETPAGIGDIIWDKCYYIRWNPNDMTTLHDCQQNHLEVIGSIWENKEILDDN